MKKLFLLFTLNFLLLNFSSAQNPLVKIWDKRFGGTHDDYFSSFLQVSEGGFIWGGSSYSGVTGDKTQNTWGYPDYWIVKTDSLGNKQWDKDFGGLSNDLLFSIQSTADGGYILGGTSSSPISGDKTQPVHGAFPDKDYWIVKIDSAGNKQWDKDFGGTGIDQLESIQQTFDHGYILGGWSMSGISGDKTQNNWDTTNITSDYWIVKTDSLGNMQWDKDFGGTGNEVFHSIQQTYDGGFILGGFSYSGISGDKTQNNWDTTNITSDYWIVKTDSLGIKQWDKELGGTNDDYLYSIQQTADDGYILGGYSYSPISGDKIQDTIGSSDYWIVKTDSLGNKQWDKDFGGNGPEELYTIALTVDGGYLLTGDSYSPMSGNKTEANLGYEQTWVVKTDSLGIILWDKTILTIGSDEIGLSFGTKDGCYVMANSTYADIGGYKSQASWLGSYDYWIVKFCDSTLSTNIANTEKENKQWLISPNPTEGNFTISGLPFATGQIEIYNMLGEKIYGSPLTPKAGTMQIQVETFPSGIYLVKVSNEGKMLTKKLVVE